MTTTMASASVNTLATRSGPNNPFSSLPEHLMSLIRTYALHPTPTAERINRIQLRTHEIMSTVLVVQGESCKWRPGVRRIVDLRRVIYDMEYTHTYESLCILWVEEREARQ